MTLGTPAANAIASNAAAAPHLVLLSCEDCLIQARLGFDSRPFTAPRCKHTPMAEITVKAKITTRPATKTI